MPRLNHIALAKLLDEAKSVARMDIVRTQDLKRATNTLLHREGWLTDVMRGYAFLVDPSAKSDSETLWQSNYWKFLAVYLGDRLGKSYCLSPENSLDFITGDNVIPKQIIVYSTVGGQGKTDLPNGCSVFVSRVEPGRMAGKTLEKDELRVMSMESALCRVGPTFFTHSKHTAIAAFAAAKIPALARAFIEGEAPEAGIDRVFSGLTQVGRAKEAALFGELLESAKVGADPKLVPLFSAAPFIKTCSPYAARIKTLWSDFRDDVANVFKDTPRLTLTVDGVLASMDAKYVNDAYHSLSIEGYKVSEVLIEKIRQGVWNPDQSDTDKEQLSAMVARGYFDAFSSVKKSVQRCFSGESPAAVVEGDIQGWYAKLFSPSLSAGVLSPSDLAGYRERAVFIRGSKHSPPPKDAVPDAMESMFSCMKDEPEPAVRAVLGHFIFTYIHPFQDGNGRLGRFLMNTLLVTEGYQWATIRSDTEHRNQYLASLEAASTRRDISPFAKFVLAEMQETVPVLEGKTGNRLAMSVPSEHIRRD